MDNQRAETQGYAFPQKQLEKVSFRNFRPFKSIQHFHPSRLNILIGPNNSGKSTFSEFLKIIGSDGFPNTLAVDRKDLREKMINKYAFDLVDPFEIIFHMNYKMDTKYLEEFRTIDAFNLCSKAQVILRYQLTSDN